MYVLSHFNQIYNGYILMIYCHCKFPVMCMSGSFCCGALDGGSGEKRRNNKDKLWKKVRGDGETEGGTEIERERKLEGTERQREVQK